MLQHPDITHAMLTGYPQGVEDPEMIGIDSLGYAIYDGDEIYTYNDEVFVAEELTYDAIEVLLKIGAERNVAK